MESKQRITPKEAIHMMFAIEGLLSQVHLDMSDVTGDKEDDEGECARMADLLVIAGVPVGNIEEATGYKFETDFNNNLE